MPQYVGVHKGYSKGGKPGGELRMCKRGCMVPEYEEWHVSGFVKEFQVCPGASRAKGGGPEDAAMYAEHSEFVSQDARKGSWGEEHVNLITLFDICLGLWPMSAENTKYQKVDSTEIPSHSRPPYPNLQIISPIHSFSTFSMSTEAGHLGIQFALGKTQRN